MSPLAVETLLHDIRNHVAGLKANVYLLRLQRLTVSAVGTLDRLERIAESLERLSADSAHPADSASTPVTGDKVYSAGRQGP